MTLEQLMAFTVTNDHECQEQVWEQISRGHNTEPYYIRRQLTEGAFRLNQSRMSATHLAVCREPPGCWDAPDHWKPDATRRSRSIQ
jgi:hypothetical protein